MQQDVGGPCSRFLLYIVFGFGLHARESHKSTATPYTSSFTVCPGPPGRTPAMERGVRSMSTSAKGLHSSRASTATALSLPQHTGYGTQLGNGFIFHSVVHRLLGLLRARRLVRATQQLAHPDGPVVGAAHLVQVVHPQRRHHHHQRPAAAERPLLGAVHKL